MRGRWENSRQLCKPETQSRVCIIVENSPNPRVKHGKRPLLLKYLPDPSFIWVVSNLVCVFQEFAELNSMCWLETSAKDCTNVKEAFDTMVYKLCESHEQYLSFQSEPSSPTSFTLHGAYGISDQQQSSGLGYCCNST